MHNLTGAYVLDALDPSEFAEFAAHLPGCPDCREEVDSFAPAVLSLSLTQSQRPPERLRGAVLAEISRVRPLPPELTGGEENLASAGESGAPASAPPSLSQTSPAQHPSAQPSSAPPGSPLPPAVALPPAQAPLAGRLRGLLAAAAVIAVIGGATVVWQQLHDTKQERVLTAQERVLAAPDAARQRLTFPGGAAATLVRSVSLKQAVLITEAMPAAPEGKVYQVWFDVPGKGMVRAALMPPKSDQVVLLHGDAAAATGAGITVEPAGGSAAPTTDPIALFDFSKLGNA